LAIKPNWLNVNKDKSNGLKRVLSVSKVIKPAVRVQYGVLPYRKSRHCLEILLVTTRESGRWIVPKGSPIKGLGKSGSAAQEAYEEAGLRGTVKSRQIGSFRFGKTVGESAIIAPCEVAIFSMHVTKQCKTWPEKKERICRWFEADEAVLQVLDEGLAQIIWSFLDKTSRRKRTH